MVRERGFSLLELLIAATVLAVALLGLGLLAVRSLDDAAALRDHTLAALLLSDLRARSELVGPMAGTPSSAQNSIAASELRGWRVLTTDLLPGAHGDVCRDSTTLLPTQTPAPCDGTGPVVARIHWQRRGADRPSWRQETLHP